MSSSSRPLRRALKRGVPQGLKFLIACALIAAVSETGMAQTAPQKCNKLQVTDFEFKYDKLGNISLFALVQNDAPYNVTYASFSFDLLVGENLKVGEASTSIGRLMHENKERVRVNFAPFNGEIKGYIDAGAIRIHQVGSSCNFVQ